MRLGCDNHVVEAGSDSGKQQVAFIKGGLAALQLCCGPSSPGGDLTRQFVDVPEVHLSIQFPLRWLERLTLGQRRNLSECEHRDRLWNRGLRQHSSGTQERVLAGIALS